MIALLLAATISITPAEVKLTGGNATPAKVTAYFDGPSMVGLVHDGCWRSPLVNIEGEQRSNTGGALVTSATDVVFVAPRSTEGGECTMTFEALVGKEMTRKSVRVVIAKAPEVGIEISPPEVTADSAHLRRVTATAHNAQQISLLRNSCGGPNPLVTVTRSDLRGNVITLELLGKRRGECTMTFSAGSNVTKDLHVRVLGP